MTLIWTDHPADAPAEGLLRTLLRGFAAYRARRARQLALATLLALDPRRLDDLGIAIIDLRDALDSR